MYGYAGKVLRVDLTAGTCGVDQLDEATARKWVGGSGLGTKYLLEEVPAGTKWSDPENLLIITSGPLGGSGAIGGGSINVAGLYTNSKSESFPSKNYSESTYDNPENLSGQRMREIYEIKSRPCYKCAIRHKKEGQTEHAYR